jgi:hypothetical protein
MIEHSIDKLPTIPDKSIIDSVISRMQSCADMTWRLYHKWIIFGFIMTAAITATIVVALTQKTMSYPCFEYRSDTLASSISVGCIQYMWNTLCPNSPYTFPLSYDGWWRSSPSGTKMVSCLSSTLCGVGSYENIRLYMQVCNIRLNQ